MTITAKFAGKCAGCGQAFAAGAKIEWSKGNPARHTACVGGMPAAMFRDQNSAAPREHRYGRGFGRRECKTGGNCSSFGSGRSCGAEECDGY